MCYIIVEDNKSEDRESTSTQNGDQPSNSDVHSSGQATAQLDYQSKLNIHYTQLSHILTIIISYLNTYFIVKLLTHMLYNTNKILTLTKSIIIFYHIH